MWRTGSFGLLLSLALAGPLLASPARGKAKQPPAVALQKANGPTIVSRQESSLGEIPTLYRRSAHQTTYWETWEGDTSIIVHTGTLGDPGRTTHLPRSATARHQVQTEVRQKRREGYMA